LKAVILCGGQGTRLREETEYKPKPMVEIGGRPILWHIMKMYSAYGIKDFILCLGYRGQSIREYFLHYGYMRNDFTIHLGSGDITVHNQHDEENWTITLVDTGQETRKGRRIKLIEPYLDDEPFMLTYGDGVADVDLTRLLDCHRAHGKIVTFTGVRPRSRWATVDLDGDGSVLGWKEKRQLASHINGGYFVMERRILDFLHEDQELEEEPMEALAALNEVAMYPHEGFWECMDTFRDYTFLNDLWVRNLAPWAVWRETQKSEATGSTK